MNTATAQLQATLKQYGYSLTAARTTVFTMLDGKEPQAMAELVASCSPAINRASVYRVTALFEQLGIVQRLPIGWKYKLELSGAFHSHHHHITCTRCAKTVSIGEDSHLETHVAEAAQTAGFRMSGHQLEIQGLCSDCIKNDPNEKHPGQ